MGPLPPKARATDSSARMAIAALATFITRAGGSPPLPDSVEHFIDRLPPSFRVPADRAVNKDRGPVALSRVLIYPDGTLVAYDSAHDYWYSLFAGEMSTAVGVGPSFVFSASMHWSRSLT